ncbi:DMT family transporter [Escherichia coli]|nr:DMT family transporter [Escherichia coli]
MQNRNSFSLKGVFFASISLVLLGIMPVLSFSRPSGYNALLFAFWLSFWQLVCAFLQLIQESRKDKRFFTVLSDSFRSVNLLFTGGLFALSTWLYVLAFDKVGPVNAAIALQMYPIFSAVTEWGLYRKKKTPHEIFWMSIIVLALFHLTTNGTWMPTGDMAGFMVALAVPALWSIAHVILRETLIRTSITPSQITVTRLIITCIFLFPATLITLPEQQLLRSLFSADFQIFALTMGGCYYLELIFWFNAVRYIDVSLASTITAPSPVITMILSSLFLSEQVSSVQFYVMLLVFTSLFMLLRGSRVKKIKMTSV